MSSNVFLTEKHLEVSRSTDGPIANDDVMRIGGVGSASAVLLVLLIGGGVFGWRSVSVTDQVLTRLPTWIFPMMILGLVLAVVSFFKPALARILAPLYAIVEGLVVGAISRVYELAFDGIVLQAAMLTIAIFAAMLLLYSTRIIKVTDRLRRGIVAATMGIMIVYGVQLLFSLLGVGLEVPFIHDSGPIGIGVSLVIVGVAAFNYLIDFDFIEGAVAARAPRHLEWTAALGLLVTTVWLYLELLRLLSKVRD